jgi:diphthamide biosynthesis methyltransferase
MICINKEAGLHTLVLLDLDPTGMGVETPRPMMPSEAVALLERMSERTENGSTALDLPLMEWGGMLLSDLGTEEERVVSGTLKELSEISTGYVHAFILPAEFSGMEEAAFERRRLPH